MAGTEHFCHAMGMARSTVGPERPARRRFVTGGARSGKSLFAQREAEALGPARVFLATAQAGDEEMAQRIARHRADRGEGWACIECPLDPAAHLDAGPIVLLDCLTLWVSNLMMRGDDDATCERAFEELCDAVVQSSSELWIVTNEVGFGLVPPNPLARRFRDLSGRLSARVAQSCDEAYLLCAGLPLRLK